jgi:hypothetical protein
LSIYKTFAYLPNSNFDDLIRDMATRTLEQLLLKVLIPTCRIRYTLDRTNPDLLVLLSTSTDLDTNITKEPVYATYPNYYGRSYGVSPYYQNYYNGYSNYNQLIGYDRILILIRKAP